MLCLDGLERYGRSAPAAELRQKCSGCFGSVLRYRPGSCDSELLFHWAKERPMFPVRSRPNTKISWCCSLGTRRHPLYARRLAASEIDIRATGKIGKDPGIFITCH